ncbi:TPA: TetR/AcrR family transcriptional regulator [Kluyvera intermedia]|uniref:TetR family transcriptional regulator n=2 Tax=Enterobacteriaceae TaxID=543 RepID=A0AAC8QUD5_9ENTR|nr:TetR/AcrR family transcriptional regulator [Phytobacter ursingii]HAT2205021.1 TetR/AcrR family transcriptional regulator [Kluyvera intermedia]AKL15153.1 TetR family transcriptional regulator [Phytobacter ursingii]HAT2515582.1 TetR/AcrR family transcriptional regulator [Kluyvera intermedia]HAT2603339.1 TetR/AcrR family transcriptional regulator [Kluyvera intermedia]HAT2680326.1 TetR/AcrR family transcriptional regulator [Kluyvera intermedia]
MGSQIARQRLSRQERYTQLIEVAWQIIREEGTEALTLGHLAERAGITKPVVYDHFTSRSGLFAALYREYDLRSTARMDEQIRQTAPVLEKLATVIADAYIECVLLSGREMPSVIAALSGTPELEQLRQEYATAFTEKCGALFAPFCNGNPLPTSALWAMLGAAEGLSWAVVIGKISAQQAKDELMQVIVTMVRGNPQ